MNDIVKAYIEHFNIDMAKAEKRRLFPTDAATLTQAKEMIGETIIKKYHLFDELFPENIGYKKVTEKSLQKAGADFQIFFENRDPIYIDLKSQVGEDYSMTREDFDTIEPDDFTLKKKAAAYELYQNDIFTNTANKITEYFLYTICDKTGVYYCLIPYREVRQTCLLHKTQYEKKDGYAIEVKHYPYHIYTSFNKTGKYIKVGQNFTQLERFMLI